MLSMLFLTCRSSLSQRPEVRAFFNGFECSILKVETLLPSLMFATPSSFRRFAIVEVLDFPVIIVGGDGFLSDRAGVKARLAHIIPFSESELTELPAVSISGNWERKFQSAKV